MRKNPKITCSWLVDCSMEVKFMVQSVYSWLLEHLKSLKVILELILIDPTSQPSANIELGFILLRIIIHICPNRKACLTYISIRIFKYVDTNSKSMLRIWISEIRTDWNSYHYTCSSNIFLKHTRKWSQWIINRLNNHIWSLSPSSPKRGRNVFVFEPMY